MSDSRIYDRVLLIERGDRWRNAIVSRFGFRVPLDSIPVDQFSIADWSRYQLFAFEFSKETVENCVAVFDKNDLSVENRLGILLGGPVGLSDRNAFREFGFVDFVDDVRELDQLEKLFLLSKERIQPVVGWRNELESQLPWPEFDSSKTKSQRG